MQEVQLVGALLQVEQGDTQGEQPLAPVE